MCVRWLRGNLLVLLVLEVEGEVFISASSKRLGGKSDASAKITTTYIEHKPQRYQHRMICFPVNMGRVLAVLI